MTTPTTKLEPWRADSTLGPRMRKSVEKVLGKLNWEGKTYYTARTGFLGDPVDPDDLRSYTTELFLGVGDRDVHPDKLAHVERCLVAEREVGECFGYTLTAENYKRVIAAYEAALITVALSRPVIDERQTPEKKAEIADRMTEIHAKKKTERDEREAVMAEVRELAPAGTQSVIVALLREDTSDVQSDYFANKTVRSVAIGFSHKTREDFRELRRVAATFLPDVEWEERRDNYSMGQGNYLSDHGWDGAGSGWVVRRYELPVEGKSGWWSVTEIAEGLKGVKV